MKLGSFPHFALISNLELINQKLLYGRSDTHAPDE